MPRRTDISSILIIGAGLVVFAASAVIASIPTGQRHGPWHVVSITSTSGSAIFEDAAVDLSQRISSGELSVRWDQPGPVFVKIHLEGCTENDDFTESYDVSLNRWLSWSSSRLARRIRSDINAWTGQAELACDRLRADHHFDLRELGPALADFNARLRYLSSFDEETN